jgi:CBS domain-containing protein
MDGNSVRDYMVPLAEYATVSHEASLFDAVEALIKAKDQTDRAGYKHRAVLVYGEDGNIQGKINQMDILRSLEPGYKKIGKGRFSHYDISPEFIKDMMQSYNLWSDPFDNICQRATEISAKEIMHTLADGEYVDADASLAEGIHQLVIYHQQSLLVTEDGKVIGILKLTDIFRKIGISLGLCT